MTSTHATLTALAFSLLLSACGGSKGSSSATVAPDAAGSAPLSYQQLIDNAVSDDIPGIILRVESPDSLFVGSAGVADRHSGAPMQVDHQMPAGSAGKPMIALLTQQLATQGLLALDGTLADWLPASLVAQIPHGNDITLRQLLNHSSGIYNFTDNAAYQASAGDNPDKLKTDADYIDYGLNQPAYFPPGEGFHYSNTNYLLIGLILERVLGEHPAAALRQQLLTPLALDATYFAGVEKDRGEIIAGYQVIDGKRVNTRPYIENFAPSAAPVVSTVGDLALFLRAVVSGDAPLDPAALDAWLAPENFVRVNEGTDYGLGIGRFEVDGFTLYGHAGGYDGYSTENYYIAETQTSISAFMNCYDAVCQRTMSELMDKVIARELARQR